VVHSEFAAILFDNDGVLVDTEELYFRATREVLAGIGADLDQAGYVEWFLRGSQGMAPLATARGLDAAAIEALRAVRTRRYQQLIAETEVAIAGAREAVQALARRYRLAIVTSSEPAPFHLAHARTGMLPHFELILTQGDYARPKPEPDPYLRAIERLGVPPHRCLVIEDSARGLRAAKAAGLTCWVIPTRLTAAGPFDAADAVLPDLGAAVARLLAVG
jgi:HAD superfamily hydrolase (TIGR01509 family)